MYIQACVVTRATPTTKAVLVAAQQERRRLRRANLANLAAALEDQLQQSEEQDRLQRIQIIRRQEDSDRETERQAREALGALELLESASIERRRLHNATLAQARVSSVSSPTESLTSSRSSSSLRAPSQTSAGVAQHSKLEQHRRPRITAGRNEEL